MNGRMKAKEVELNPLFLFWTSDFPKTVYFVTLVLYSNIVLLLYSIIYTFLY